MKQFFTFLFKNNLKTILAGFAMCSSSAVLAQSYCTPTYGNGTVSGDFISFVEIQGTSLSNSSGGNGVPSYTTFPQSGSTTANLVAGTTYTLNVKGGAYSTCFIAGWADWNHNGTFETTEYLGLTGNVGNMTLGSVTFSVPASANPGTTRLRFRSTDTSPGPVDTEACGNTNSGYGEAEDYDIIVIPATNCSGTPVAGDAVSSSNAVCPGKSFVLSLVNNVIDGGIEYQWQSSPDGSTWSNLGSPQVSWTYSIGNLSADTYYRCVATCTSAVASSTSTPIQVLLNAFVNCYCTPQTQDCTNGDSFNSIDFLTISDQSLSCNAGNNGYEDRTAVGTATVNAGQTFSLNFNVNNGNNGNGVVGAWIDEDHNAVFDPWEYRSLNTIVGSGSYVGYISVPITALGGNTRMRLKLEASGNSITSQDPCTQQNYYGEVYDYMLSITAAPSCAGTPSGANAIANPTLVCQAVPINLNLYGVTESGINYQWQSSVDGSNWTNIGTSQNTIPYTVTSQSVSTYYRCELTCSTSSLTAASNTVLVSQITATNCYCTPGSLDCSNITISDISFANLSETVACVPGGYSDNTWSSPTVSVTANQTYTLSSNILCPAGNGHLGAWIDYNKNGIFEQNEFNFIGYSSSGLITNTIAIPFTASGGNYKMRVKLEFDWGYPHSLDPCINNASEGITLDYFLDVTPAPACAGTPNAGDAVASQTLVCANTKLTLTLANNDITSDNMYQWQESTDNTNWTNLGAPQSYVMHELYTSNVDKYYRCLVTCQNSSLTAASNTVAVIQNAITNCYCVPPPSDCSGTNITNVQFSNLNNASACNTTDGYTDYTQSVASASISAGQTYTLTTTHTNDFGNEVAIWIDYDKNGFFDPSEFTYIGSSAGSGIYDISSNVSVPVNAPLGNTRMRVRTGYSANWQSTQPCDAPSGGDFKTSLLFNFDGETEDYLVTIMPPDCSVLNIPPNVTSTISNDSICSGNQVLLDITPAMPVATGFGYQWKSSSDGVSYSDIGTPLSSSSLSLNPTATTYYICEVQCNTNAAVTSSSVMVTVSSMTAVITVTDITCFGANNGQAEMLVTGGLTPYTYSWSPGGAASTVINSLTQGTYTCQVTDVIGCTISNTVTVNEPTAITTAITASANVSCNGLADGFATISASGGTGSLSYLWQPTGGTNSTENNLAPGTYSCVVTDANSCTSSETVTITEPPVLTATSSQTNVSCYGGNNGIASVTATGGTPNYTYFWSHGFGAAGTTISGNVTAQTYTCTITDANSCSITQTVTITEPVQILLAISGNTSTCITGTSTFSVSVTNAVGALTYTWSTLPTGSVSTNPTFNYTATAAGTETVYVNVTDANGCSQLSSGYPVVIPASTDISGTILDGGNSSPVAGIAILYKYEPFYTKFDSVSFRTIDAAGNYTFSPVNYGQYIVKAVPTNTLQQITYGTNSVNWKTASIINHGCANSDIQNINVVPLASINFGIGALSGQIREGNGFGKRIYSPTTPLYPGNPIGGIIVKGGKNPGGTMFRQTVTDQNGNYSIGGLPINTNDTFFILVDIPGLDTNTTYHKVLTTGNPAYTGLDFIVDSAKITPVENAVGINEINKAEHQIKLFPNPAKNKVTITYSLPASATVSIGLYDIPGKEIKTIMPRTEQAKDEYSYTVQLNDIATGMYFVKLKINNSESIIKLIITD